VYSAAAQAPPDPETAGELAEAALVRSARTDQAAFGTLYARYVDRVYGYLLGQLGNREDAEDLTSLTFARALTSLSRFRGQCFPAWLFAIARNAAANHRRRPPTSELGSLVDQITATTPDPLAQVLASEGLDVVRRLIEELPEEQRELLPSVSEVV
jgi:RNA polymerase sigma-70 factor (ECF subfamily)